MTLEIRQFNSKTIRIRPEDRYVCLTDMAKASGKLFADWKRLKATESYLETLSRIMGMPIIQLIEVNVGNLGEMSGTWGHSKVALRFAQWCSDEFAVQVDIWIDELLTTGKVELNKQEPNTDLSVTDEIKAEMDILSFGLSIANLDPALISGFVLNYAGKHLNNRLAGEVNEAHKLLAATTETDLLLTPTSIGKQLGISARKVNLLLLDIGYQVKNVTRSKGDPDYLPTELGQPYAENTMATGKLYGAKVDNTTYQHLKWKAQIVEILREHLPMD